MGAFTKGDIVLFPFPYTNLSVRKIRPCLVLSEEMGEDLILCQITSNKIRKDNFSVDVQQNETLNGSLQVDSYVRANMLFTAAKIQIKKKICSLSTSKYGEVVSVILRVIRR
ncbi:type II toxin-antitoxin system PemK/MazF family toxin [Candidatus Woesearchaeota archaeon]|nr:type II toxin-antitoxin system PemK/MazF family toxin [Candidatus Woesearchaeota archaeon]